MSLLNLRGRPTPHPGTKGRNGSNAEAAVPPGKKMSRKIETDGKKTVENENVEIT